MRAAGIFLTADPLAYAADVRGIRQGGEKRKTRGKMRGKGDAVDTGKRHEVIVVGAGASGMTAALVLAQRGVDVALLEANDAPGKKLLATGNGKCNFTNSYQSAECYRGGRPEAAMELLERYGVAYVLRFFGQLGILAKQRDGYWYPNPEQAACVREAFVLRLSELKVPVYENTHVDEVRKGDGFMLVTSHRDRIGSTGRMAGKKKERLVLSESRRLTFGAGCVVLATGGCAGNISGADGSGYALASALGHHIVPPVPALVQLRLAGKWGKALAGVRQSAALLLRITRADGVWEVCERGELLFTDYGLSGIPAMQLSRFAACELAKGESSGKIEVSLDFFPDTPENDLQRMLLARFLAFPGRAAAAALNGLLPAKLNAELLAAAGILPGASPLTQKGGGEPCAGALAHCMKHFACAVSGTNGFESAQAAAGGVSLDELDVRTMESKLVKGLYVTGELADIDGTCGGYNLQWAWMSGLAAAEAICGRKNR